MPLAIGDQLWFDGALGEVVAMTATTDENGRGSIAHDGRMFHFRVLKALPAGETEFPWVATDDAYWRMGLVKHPEADLYCLVSDDPPAPGWGRWIEQQTWKEAADFAGEGSVVFILGWRPGIITIKKGGVVQSDVYADFVLLYDTDLDGECEAWWQPVYPYADGKGSFRTDAAGHLWDVRTGSPQHIIVSRGFAALGHRPSDTWPSMPEAERVLESLYVRYLQERAEISEGSDTELDIAAVSIALSGPPGANFDVFYDEGFYCDGGTLDGSGEATVTGLPPGKYAVSLHHASDSTKGLRRQSVTCSESGGTYELAFGGTWSSFALATTCGGYIYEGGATGAANITVWGRRLNEGPPLRYTWEPTATTDSDGYFEFDTAGLGWVPSELAVDCEQGAWWYDGGIGQRWLDPCLGGRISGALTLEDKVIVPPGFEYPTLVPWGAHGAHKNMPSPERLGYAVSSLDGSKHYFSPNGHGGTRTDRLPAWQYRTRFAPETSDDRITYGLHAADGTELGCEVVLGAGTTPPWIQETSQTWANSSHCGQVPAGQTGGKIHGAAVEADPPTRITSALVEPWRLGLEFGKVTGPLEVRINSDSIPKNHVVALTFTAFKCPYCASAIWNEPSNGSFTRWCCTACGAIAEAGFTTRTVAALKDWWTRIVKTTTGGLAIDRKIAGHPRPEEYGENDNYIQMIGGLTRWVAKHITLGTLQGGAFADGESIADAEARLGRTVGPLMLKLELQDDYHGGGKIVRVTPTHATEGSKVLTTIIPPGSVAGDVFPLDWSPHHDYPRGYYTDVTAATDEGDGYLHVTIVNDGPAWHSGDGAEVTHQASTPWACDVFLGSRDPAMTEDFGGILHLTYCRDGRVMHRTSEDTGSTWSALIDVTQRAGWSKACSNPSPVIMPWGEEKIMATSGGRSVMFSSLIGGDTWTATA